MAYLVPFDLLTRFGAGELAQLTDRGVPRRLTPELLIAFVKSGDLSAWGDEDVTAAERAVACMTQAIGDGQSEVDAYLSSRYTVPLANPPSVLKRFTGDIARFALYDDHATEEVRRRYEDAISFLKAVAAGKASLGADEGAELPAGGNVEMVTAGRVFGRRERGL